MKSVPLATGRPIFRVVGTAAVEVSLPRGARLSDVAAQLASMLGPYQPGRFVYEEVWHGRQGAPSDAGALTAGERAAILAGSPRAPAFAGVRVERSLWQVVEAGEVDAVELRAGDDSVQAMLPTAVVLQRCGQPGWRAVLSLEEVGLRFSQPFPLDLDGDALRAFAAAYNQRRDWRLLWLQALGRRPRPLAAWTRPRGPFVQLLTLAAPETAAAFAWWGTSTSWAGRFEGDGGEDGDEAGCAEPEHTLLPDAKMLVPRGAAISLGRFWAAKPAGRPPPTPRFPPPDAREVTSHNAHYTNPFALYRAAGGGQAVELATLASYLGSAAHLSAMRLALHKDFTLPTALLQDEAGGWGALDRYLQTVPPVARAVGRGLLAGLRPVAVEFPVYWLFGLVRQRSDPSFVYSRIDAVAEEEDGALAVWEFKTKWGQARCHEARPLAADVRQAALYAYLLQHQTGRRVGSLYVRYAAVTAEGAITIYTHRHTFEPAHPAYRAVLAGALARCAAYADADLVQTDATELRRLAWAVRTAPAPHTPGPHSPAMPPYAVLRLAGRQHALLPLAQVDGPVVGPWREHPGTHARRAAGDRATGTGQDGVLRQAGSAGAALATTAADLNAAVQAAAAALAPLPPASRAGLARLRTRLARLYGPGAAPAPASALEALVRGLHRGVNALVWVGGGAPAGAPFTFVHDSGRSGWDAGTLATAQHRYLPAVAAQVANELRALAVPLDPP